VGLDCRRRGSAADRISDHRWLEQQHQYGKHWLVANGDQRCANEHAEHDGFGLDIAETGDARGTNGSGSGPVAGRRQINCINN